AAEQRHAEPLTPERLRLAGPEIADLGRFGRAKTGDLDQYVVGLRLADCLHLDEAVARPFRFGVAQLTEALGVGVPGRVLGIDSIDVLDQPDAMRVELRGEE